MKNIPFQVDPTEEMDLSPTTPSHMINISLAILAMDSVSEVMPHHFDNLFPKGTKEVIGKAIHELHDIELCTGMFNFNTMALRILYYYGHNMPVLVATNQANLSLAETLLLTRKLERANSRTVFQIHAYTRGENGLRYAGAVYGTPMTRFRLRSREEYYLLMTNGSSSPDIVIPNDIKSEVNQLIEARYIDSEFIGANLVQPI